MSIQFLKSAVNLISTLSSFGPGRRRRNLPKINRILERPAHCGPCLSDGKPLSQNRSLDRSSVSPSQLRLPVVSRKQHALRLFVNHAHQNAVHRYRPQTAAPPSLPSLPRDGAPPPSPGRGASARSHGGDGRPRPLFLPRRSSRGCEVQQPLLAPLS
eukprot:COSAG01_NODE_9199_length_2523_cov_2.215347_4_plen_157_part_00